MITKILEANSEALAHASVPIKVHQSATRNRFVSDTHGNFPFSVRSLTLESETVACHCQLDVLSAAS